MKGGRYKNKKLTPTLNVKGLSFGLSVHQCSLNRETFFIIDKADPNERTKKNAVFHNVTWHFNKTSFHVRLPVLMPDLSLLSVKIHNLNVCFGCSKEPSH